MDSRQRSVVKAVIWNLIGLVSMAFVGLAATGSWALGGKMALINAGLGLSCYVIYERIWAKVRWGRLHG